MTACRLERASVLPLARVHANDRNNCAPRRRGSDLCRLVDGLDVSRVTTCDQGTHVSEQPSALLVSSLREESWKRRSTGRARTFARCSPAEIVQFSPPQVTGWGTSGSAWC